MASPVADDLAQTVGQVVGTEASPAQREALLRFMSGFEPVEVYLGPQLATLAALLPDRVRQF